jgi:hypothetical protein
MMRMKQHIRIELLQRYETGPILLEEALKGFPVTMWKFKPAANKWSIHEIVIHLADSEVQSYVRCRMIIAEPGTTIPNHDEHQWSVALSYATRDIAEALDAIRLVRRMNTKLLNSIAEPLWLNSCNHSLRGRITLDDWLATYAAHIPHHIEQMKRTNEAWASRKAE